MSTIYTLNGKVLKNSANDKWLIKKESPLLLWMAKNLDIDDGGGGIYHVDNVTANGVNFGTQYYYTWDAAVRVANSITGWHLPTSDEWNTLATYVGGSDIAGTKLKSTSGWYDDGNGTDDFGFTVLPVGSYVPSVRLISQLGKCGSFWTNTEYTSTNAYNSDFLNTDSNMRSLDSSKSNCYSVRLVKDT